MIHAITLSYVLTGVSITDIQIYKESFLLNRAETRHVGQSSIHIFFAIFLEILMIF